MNIVLFANKFIGFSPVFRFTIHPDSLLYILFKKKRREKKKKKSCRKEDQKKQYIFKKVLAIFFCDIMRFE